MTVMLKSLSIKTQILARFPISQCQHVSLAVGLAGIVPVWKLFLPVLPMQASCPVDRAYDIGAFGARGISI